MIDQSPSPALKRFRELVRQRRALLSRKERADMSSIYAAASLRQILEQVDFELKAGVEHDAGEIRALIELAGERVAAVSKKAPTKARFRGIGR